MMPKEPSIGELSILHSLRDGDAPLLRVPESELIYFTRDVAHLVLRGMVAQTGQQLALTLAGIAELERPGSRALPADLYSDPKYLHRMFGSYA